jgi:microsomal dipeptidase-like Zn-dependent dipeptidase
MNRLGMLIDLSHSGERTCLETINASNKPVAITHSNPSTFHMAKRNKSDRVLKALAERGGVLGFVLYPYLIGGAQVSLQSFCDMIAKTIDLIGIDHVGFGSDLTLNWPDDHVKWLRMGRWTFTENFGPASPNQSGWPEWPKWFQSSADYPNIFKALAQKGFSGQELTKIMGGNWLRLFEATFQSD